MLPPMFSDDRFCIPLGIVLILVSMSYFWKCYYAVIRGQINYSNRFFPEVTFLSALIVPPWTSTKKSFIDTRKVVWVHVFLGPLFFMLAVCTLLIGFDYAGLHGTDIVNLGFSGGQPDCAQAIIFNRRTGYQFPIMDRAAKNINRMIHSCVLLATGEARH
jgi:hypothetical protein